MLFVYDIYEMTSVLINYLLTLYSFQDDITQYWNTTLVAEQVASYIIQHHIDTVRNLHHPLNSRPSLKCFSIDSHV